MKDIWTVTISYGRDLSTVSFLNFDDAVNYAVDEVMNKEIDGISEEEVRMAFEEDNYFQPWGDEDDFISIDPTKLCTSYKRGSL